MRRLIREHRPVQAGAGNRGGRRFNRSCWRWRTSNFNGTAANNILTRFKKLFPGRRFPKPEDLAKVTDEQIRACGFSFAKIAAIRDIAEKTLAGVVPSSRQIVKLSDEEIIARLTEVRGVGRWTVEMLVIFQLGRHGRFAGGRFWRAQRLSPRLQKTRDAEAERPAQVRRKLAAAPHHGGVVSLARGGSAGAEEKEVTTRRDFG